MELVLYQNRAEQRFHFLLLDAVTGAAITGATPVVTVAKGGAAYGAAAGGVNEKGNGVYQYELDITETGDTNVAFLVAATGGALPILVNAHFFQTDVLVDGIFDRSGTMDNRWSFRQFMRLLVAAIVGNVEGAGTDTITFRSTLGGNRARIVNTTDIHGNRVEVSRDVDEDEG